MELHPNGLPSSNSIASRKRELGTIRRPRKMLTQSEKRTSRGPPYLPVIVWIGVIKVMLDATLDHDAQSMTDPTDLTMSSASIIPFPASRAVAVVADAASSLPPRGQLSHRTGPNEAC